MSDVGKEIDKMFIIKDLKELLILVSSSLENNMVMSCNFESVDNLNDPEYKSNVVAARILERSLLKFFQDLDEDE